MKISVFTLITMLLLALNVSAQFSKTHYIPPLSNSDAQEPQAQLIYISCPSLTPVQFKIYEMGGTIITGTVSRNAPYVYNIGTGFDTQLLVSEANVSTVMSNKGYIVEAEDLVYVTVRLTSTPQNFQGGGLVAKGIAALGTQFRVGAFLNTGIPTANDNHYTFASILATENNTTISFDDIKPGVVLVNDAASGNTPPNVVLNAGESYVIAVSGALGDANRDGLIGTLIASDKPIAVNCGSFAGTNGTANNLDLGFDQLVSAERTGNQYIFIKGNGVDVTERPLIVAHQDNTAVYLNGSTTPFATINAGEYLALDGTNFSANGNLYVNTSNNVFAFQGIGGTTNQANQNMHFLPPLSCQTPKSIDNIPFINEVGSITNFTGTVNVVTETGAALTFTINGTDYTLASLPTAGVTINGPLTVTGNNNYVTYTFNGLNGNISVFSTKQLYLSYFGSSGAATYGGFYSGFTFKPEITFDQIDIAQSQCIPNVELKVSSLSGFDTFQWYFNNTPIAGANSITYTPDLAPPFGTGLGPGNYYVSATLSTCNISLVSDNIPVSVCPTDRDNDQAIDNVDQDNDNDGITNCTESYGNQAINISNPASSSISVGTYSNSFVGQVTTSATASTVPFTGSANGSFISDLPAGKTNWVNYEMNFAQPIDVGLEYVATANTTDLLNSQAEYTVTSDINRNVTVLNPNDQLLIDTNYDGFYESGITQFSSFEIRFRLNNTVPLAAGTGTFKFLSSQTTKISFKHRNLSDAQANRVTLKFFAACVPKDSDNDGVSDALDHDSDNDGITDGIEAQGANPVAASNTDVNGDGIDDAFGTGLNPADSDNDNYPDYLDLDSDNDGIFDVIEAGIPANQSNTNGILITSSFGPNGLADNLETSPESGVLNYTPDNNDADANSSYIDLDSDGDGCNDVIEAGFSDPNNDGILGNATPPVILPFGLVSSSSGYSIPNPDYHIAAPISITTQPQDVTSCELQAATFTLASNPVDAYQWQLSTDGGTTWNNLANNAAYSGVNTVTLTVNNILASMSGYQYRVFLSKNGNSCGLYSSSAILTTYPMPVVTSPVTLVQCDDDTDGIAAVNLTQKNSFISANYLSETFTYYTTATAAAAEDAGFQINNPVAYITGTTTVYGRVENANGCYRVAQLDVTVSVTQIPPGTLYSFYTCDDYIDAVNNDYDGISLFDFSSVTPALQAIIPSTSAYTIKYYKNQNDALSEINEITNISNYRNIGYPNQQFIWVRVDSNIDNACFGLGPYIKLTVERLPVAYPLNGTNTIRHCDDDQDGIYGFNTAAIEQTILNGQTNMQVTYTDDAGNPLPSPLPSPFQVNGQLTVHVRVTNNSTQAANGPCYDEMTFQFIVDDLPQAFALTPGSLTICDGDGADSNDHDGLYPFDTTNIQNLILNGQTGVNISYTLPNGTVLNQLPNPFISPTQNVIATVTNPTNTSCTATTVLNFVVNPLPNIELFGEAVICTNLPGNMVLINAGLTDGSPITAYTYQWALNGTNLPNTTYSLNVHNVPGTYTATVTSAQGCSRTRTITVIESHPAVIEDIVITDLTDDNTVEIIVSGIGNYVYSLDDGPYQQSNVFTNVAMGFHTVRVQDLNECGIVDENIAVLGIPHYFTPNGDGVNDYWNIKGVVTAAHKKSLIQVFDRYGKLMKEFSPNSPGWDGTYNGYQAISDDYWYVIKLQDGRTLKGHFALKR